MLLVTSLLCMHSIYDEINAESERGFGKGGVGRKLGNMTTGMSYLLRETYNKSLSTTIMRSNGNKDEGDI